MSIRRLRGFVPGPALAAGLLLGASPAGAQPAAEPPSAAESARASQSNTSDSWLWAKPWRWKPPARTKMFRDNPWYEPLRGEPHAARTFLLIPAWSDEFPHSEQRGRRFAWQVSLGRELPIVSVSSQVADGTMDANNWAIGLWTPVSFHVIEDFKDQSNPIVDTDYRFGAMVKFQYGISETFRLGLRYVPWAHESTHLGDEYTILALPQSGFERVNVSYEYQEYGISLEGNDLFAEGDDWLVRHGGIDPWGPDGYYSNHLLGSDEPRITPSRKNYEPSFGLEYLLPEWRGRQTYLSFDLRDKLVYTYHQTADNPERRQWSWTLQVGRTSVANSRSALKDYFFQVYRGVNPYGQLRSQSDYWSAGFGWVFGL